MVVQKVTPRTGVAVAQLNKIDGTVEFRAPAKGLDFSHARINLDERTRPQKRIEREVPEADVTVLAVPDIEMLDQGNRNFSPKLDHARQKIGVVDVERPVETDREGNGTVGVVHFQRGQVSLRQRGSDLVEAQFVEVKTVETEKIGKFQPVDGA